ncbi:MAG: hypothetical protein HY033_03725 [Ignavibacteriae bacterium]|nr:hypothetical protein [Ignavibacteriota bacterium]
MLNKRTLSTICLSIFFANIGFSQGAYLESGHSGFGIVITATHLEGAWQ